MYLETNPGNEKITWYITNYSRWNERKYQKKKTFRDLHQHQPYPLYMTVDARNQNFLKIRVDAVPTKKLNHS